MRSGARWESWNATWLFEIPNTLRPETPRKWKTSRRRRGRTEQVEEMRRVRGEKRAKHLRIFLLWQLCLIRLEKWNRKPFCVSVGFKWGKGWGCCGLGLFWLIVFALVDNKRSHCQASLTLSHFPPTQSAFLFPSLILLYIFYFAVWNSTTTTRTRRRTKRTATWWLAFSPALSAISLPFPLCCCQLCCCRLDMHCHAPPPLWAHLVHQRSCCSASCSLRSVLLPRTVSTTASNWWVHCAPFPPLPTVNCALSLRTELSTTAAAPQPATATTTTAAGQASVVIQSLRQQVALAAWSAVDGGLRRRIRIARCCCRGECGEGARAKACSTWITSSGASASFGRASSRWCGPQWHRWQWRHHGRYARQEAERGPAHQHGPEAAQHQEECAM